MSKVIYEPRPRYVVEYGTANLEAASYGRATVVSYVEWDFHAAFDSEQDAKDEALLVAKYSEWVRVIDREAP